MKKIALQVVLLSTLALVLWNCVPREAAFSPGEIVYEPTHAAGFRIYEAGGESRAIRIVDPWQGAQGVEQWVFLPGNGEQPPAGFTGTVLSRPARRIVCMSSSHVAFLGELGAGGRVVGVSGGDFITDSLVRARLIAGDIADVGYDTALDFERLASLRPDLMLVYGVNSGNDAGVTGKLREMGVPYVFVGDYLESSPQGRAEWLVAVSAMCGLFEEGVSKFGEITRAYDEWKTRAAEWARDSRRPEVMFNAPYRDIWYVPGDDNYMVRFIRDAGGEYVCRGVGGHDSRPIDIEEAFVAMRKADFWLGTGQYSTIASLLADNPRFAATPPVRDGRVFNNNARTTPAGGSDFWESGVVRPDRVLYDLVTILHPESFSANDTIPRSLYYYSRLK